MKRPWYSSIVFLLCAIGTLWGASSANAEATTSDGESPLSFSYQVIQPENQRSDVSYFDLRMTPGQKQTVQIELRNDTSKKKTIEVSINGTTTNSNGVIENGPSTIEADPSLRYAFEELVRGPETVNLPAKGKATVELTIQMPAETYDGVISGGIQLKEAVDEKERAKQVGVINEYSFLVGMLLTETDTEVLPELALNKVFAGANGSQSIIYANISNTQAAYIGDLTLSVEISQAGKAAILYETKKSGLQMGPNNQMDFPVPLNGGNLVAGEYEAHVKATSGERNWSWDQAFTVTDEDVQKANQQNLGDGGNKGINWLLVSGLIAGILLVGVGVFLVVRRMNRGTLKAKKGIQKRKQPSTGKPNGAKRSSSQKEKKRSKR